MDIDFLNSYTEVLTENFDAVLKQNLMFQTQLKIVQKQKEEKEQLQNNLNETMMEIERLNQIVSQQQSDLSKAETLKLKFLKSQKNVNQKSQKNLKSQKNVKQKFLKNLKLKFLKNVNQKSQKNLKLKFLKNEK